MVDLDRIPVENSQNRSCAKCDSKAQNRFCGSNSRNRYGAQHAGGVKMDMTLWTKRSRRSNCRPEEEGSKDDNVGGVSEE